MQQSRVMETSFIANTSSSSVARSARRALLPVLTPFPIACFAGALVTDLAYWQTPDVMWANFSVWLIAAGMVLAAIAAIAGVIDFFGGRKMPTLGWPHAVGYVLAVVLSLFNVLVHSRDGYTAVVPTGLMLSTLVVVILLATSWLGSVVVNRGRMGGSI